MSTIVNAKVSLEVLFNEIISGGLKSGVVPTKLSELITLSTGTSDGQVNLAWAKRESGIGASVTTVYNLIATLLNTEGAAITFDEVVLIALKNRGAAATDPILVGPDASDGFGVLASGVGFWADASDRNVVVPGGDSWVVMYAKGGVPVGASTKEIAVITASGSSANGWDIIILGRDNP